MEDENRLREELKMAIAEITEEQICGCIRTYNEMRKAGIPIAPHEFVKPIRNYLDKFTPNTAFDLIFKK